VYNDISLNMDTGKVTALTLLDLSAAFDTIDYAILLDRLSDWYGISGTAFTGISSFLINRFQSIQIRNCFSKVVPFFLMFPFLMCYISLSVVKIVATALITSRLDYCNSLLYNIASKDILKLQCI